MKQWDETFQNRTLPAWFKKCLRARHKKLHPYSSTWDLDLYLRNGWINDNQSHIWDHYGSVLRDGFRAVITQPYGDHDAEAQKWAEEHDCVLAVAKEGGPWAEGTWYYEFHPKPPNDQPHPQDAAKLPRDPS